MKILINDLIKLRPKINAVRRAAIALQIYLLDQEYQALGDYITDTDANKAVAEHERRIVLMRRTQAFAEFIKLGGL